MILRARTGSDELDHASTLAGYVPRLIEQHQRDGGGARLLGLAGTLVSADISGFTALSERLAELGNEGSEQLTQLLNRCFSEMIDVCEQHGGDIVKFGGDALLVLFTGDDHARHAAVAMIEMRRIVSGDWSTDSAKRVSLGISQGAHSGLFGFSLADAGHVELLVGGPAVSVTVACEGEAGRGQILVSADMAELLPADWLGPATDSGARTLTLRRVTPGLVPPAPLVRAPVDGLDQYLSGSLVDAVLAGVHGEHRQVVIAFVDVAETDTLYEREGGLAVHEACGTIADNLRQVLERHPVHLLASDAYVNGTKLILTAGAPVSTDADEDHMLLALHELFAMDNPLPMKAGVNRGHVFVGDLGGPTRRAYTVMGDAVNLAARLMQHAHHGQVVASADVLDRSTTRFETDELPPFHVKGKSKPIRAAVVGQPIEVDAEQQRHLGHVGFVGRVDELAQLVALATGAANGHGCTAEVSGEPGIGKSRLVREVLQRSPDLRIVRMRGGHYARNTPFFTIGRLLRRELGIEAEAPADVGRQLTAWVADRAPELAPWLPLLAIPAGAEVPPTAEVGRLADQFRRDRLLAVTADLLAVALDEPVALLAEDIHLFDAGSLDVYRQLAARAGDRPWFLIATHRSEPGLVDRTAHAVTLSALGHDELTALALAAGELSGAEHGAHQLERLAERAGGNPLFLLELTAAVRDAAADELPDTVESLVTVRIDLLPASDRSLLREASVSGNIVDARLFADAFDRPDLRHADRWHALTDFLVTERPDVYRFRHGLYRDVAYSGLSYRRRREAHAAIGSTIESRNADNLAAVAPLLSDHFERARDRRRAWTYAVLGGNTARDAYANDEAISLYERALRNADGADPRARSDVAESLGDVHQLIGGFGAAVEAFQASRSYHGGGEADEVRLLRKIGGVRLREGSFSQALRWLTRARTALPEIGDARVRASEDAEIALSRAGALHRQGRNDECAAWAEAAAHSAELADHRGARARAYNMLDIAYRTLGRPDDAARYADLALEMYAGSGDLVGEANVLNNRGVQAHFAGNWTQAIADYDRSRLLRRQAGDVVGEAMAANNIGEIRCLQNRFDEAREHFASAQAGWHRSGYTVGVAYLMANQAMLEARSGDVEPAVELLEQATEMMVQLKMTSLVHEARQRRIEIHLLAGRPDLARAEAEELFEELRDRHVGDDQLTVQLAPLLGLAQLRTGDVARASEILARAVEDAEQAGDRYVEAVARHALAELAEATGEDATELRRRADELAAQLDVIGRPAVIDRLVLAHR